MEDESGVVPVLSKSFPDEMIVETLKRLPVKSLLRFKSVSKPWLSVISARDFIKSHKKIAATNSRHSLSRLICVHSNPGNQFREYSVRLMADEPYVDPLILSYLIGDSTLTMRIVGSCEGLVCVSVTGNQYVIWNPSIRKYKNLPCFQIIGGGNDCQLKDGFGYLESSDDYKVLILLCSSFTDPCPVYIYGMRSNQWKRIQDFSFGPPEDTSAKYACGKLHWLSFTNGFQEIISLDLNTERYERMVAADNGSGRLCTTLGEFQGKLCMAFDDHMSNIYFWVMNEYGVGDSWTRLFRLPFIGMASDLSHMLRLWSLKDDQILISYGGIVIIYSTGNEPMYYPAIREYESVHHADVYVESLISPPDW